MKNIAVIGATGMLGQRVTHQLIKAGYNLILLVRDLPRAQNIFGDAVKYIPGDLQQPETLKNFLHNQEGLYINLSVSPSSKQTDYQPEKDGLKQVLKLAKEMSIKRVGYLASLVQYYQNMNGFKWWVFEIKQEAIKIVQTCGIPYTIFYPSNFMENFDQGNYKQGKRIALAGKSLYPMHFIAADDYGTQVAKAFENNSSESKEYVIQGPEAYTSEQAAEIFMKNYKKENLTIAKAPLGLLKFIGVFDRKLNYASHIIEAINNYPEKFQAQNTWQELGKPTITLEAYAKSR